MAHFLELAHHLRRAIPISQWTPLFVLLGIGLCLLSWRWVATRTGWRSLPTLGALLTLAGALALTLSPRGWDGNHRSLAQCIPTDWAEVGRAASHVGSSLESLLNVGLLTPFGIALVLASRRVIWPAAVMVLLPTVVELSQTGIRGRECSATDWIANALGGLIGVALGWAAERWWRARQANSPGPGGPPGTDPGEPVQPPVFTKS
jgi:hypothetical protein